MNTSKVTKIVPSGVTFEFSMDEKTYYVHLFVDFIKEKVYGNTNIESFQLIIFDELFNRVEYDDDIYPHLEKYVQDVIINET